MKRYLEIESDQIMHVISEPGDGTRYQYMVWYDGHYTFKVMGTDSDVTYPRALDYWEIKDAEHAPISSIQPVSMRIADDQKCNPYTVQECIRTALELHRRYNHLPAKEKI